MTRKQAVLQAIQELKKNHEMNEAVHKLQEVVEELLTPDEVRVLDNRYALLFIRGERPILDDKYDVLKYPNVALTTRLTSDRPTSHIEIAGIYRKFHS